MKSLCFLILRLHSSCLTVFTDGCSMVVKVLYKNKEIMSHHVTEPAGCIIAYHPIGDQGKLLDDVGLSFIKEKVSSIQIYFIEISTFNVDRNLVYRYSNVQSIHVVENVSVDLTMSYDCLGVWSKAGSDRDCFTGVGTDREWEAGSRSGQPVEECGARYCVGV